MGQIELNRGLSLLVGCTTWTLTKRLEKKLDGNYTRMLRAILNRSWRQHPTRHQLYGRLPPITKTIQVRWIGHVGHCWKSRDELISDVLLWTPTHGRAKAGRPAQTYIQQLCEDTGCCPEDLPRAMNDRSGERGSGMSVLPARHDDDEELFKIELFWRLNCVLMLNWIIWNKTVHQLYLCRGVRPPPPMSVLDMTLINLMVRFHWCWGFGQCGALLHCHCSQVHSGPEW